MSNIATRISALAVVLMAAGLARAQGVEEIARSHGGEAARRLERCEARGVADTPDGRLEFALKVAGDRSRLEIGDRVFVRQGAVGRWRSSSGRWSDAGRVWEGLRDVYLLPLFPVGELGYFARRSEAPGWAFRRVVARRTHIGFQAPRPVVDLNFDPATGLLSEPTPARWSTTTAWEGPCAPRSWSPARRGSRPTTSMPCAVARARPSGFRSPTGAASRSAGRKPGTTESDGRPR